MKMECITKHTLKKGFSLILILAMILGIMQTAALPVFGEEDPQESKTVNVRVVPDSAEVSFYSDAELSESITATDSGISGKYHMYQISTNAEKVFFRASDGAIDLGGDYFSVGADTITLVRHDFYINYSDANTMDAFSFKLKQNGGDSYVCLGEAYLNPDKADKLYYSALLVAGVKYDASDIQVSDLLLINYYSPSLSSFTTKDTVTAIQAKTVTLIPYKQFELVVPLGADVRFFHQETNYVVEEIQKDGNDDLTVFTSLDKTVTYKFKSKTSAYDGTFSFRVTTKNKLTYSGFFANGKRCVVSFDENRTPRSEYSDLSYDDRSILLNSNHIDLSVGDSFKLRAFRAAWEIIDSTTANHMIEPDFHHEILTGEDVIELSLYEDLCSGNADENWVSVSAIKEGTAIIATYYDAIEVLNSSVGSSFGASDPARYGMSIVRVGDTEEIEWNVQSSDGDWDEEFDTVYYSEDKGYITISPAAVSEMTVQHIYGLTMSAITALEQNEDGSWTVPLSTGTNVVAAHTENGTDYLLIRARQISYTITNNTTGESGVNSAPLIRVGDSVTVSFNENLDMPVPKMSGVYNPGYMGTGKTIYLLNDKYLLASKGTQYDFSDSSKNSLTFTAYVSGENHLNGYISLSSMGDPFGCHREITDEGRNQNFQASEKFGQFGLLPDISFNVTDSMYPIDVEANKDEFTKIDSVSIFCGLSTYQTGFNFNKCNNDYFDVAWTAANKNLVSGWPLNIKITTKEYYNTITAEYWYEGEATHGAVLQNGITTAIQPSEFTMDAAKILHILIKVTPEGGSDADAKTILYSVAPNVKDITHEQPPENPPVVPPVNPPEEPESDTISVKFRLIGCVPATKDVNLASDAYLPEYVNWIKTKTYALDKGSTVKDLFLAALEDAGLNQSGAESGYVSSITAPEALGSYSLAEMDNGMFSGWMYSVNGVHPNVGLDKKVLQNGDKVIWHYVNDYRYEVDDWFSGTLGESDDQNKWLNAKDKNPEDIEYTYDGPSSSGSKKNAEIAETPAAVYTDVKETDWFAPYVNKARDLKIMEGVGDNKFDPKGKLLRSMMIQILYNLEGRPEISGETPFKDIKAGSWYEKATIWAYKNGIIKGNGSELLNPSGDITRAELLTMLYRYAGLKNLNVTSSGSIDTFNDYKKVKSWAEDAFKWAAGKEIVEGTDLNTLEPVSDAIRAEAAKIMVKFVETK